MLCAEDLHFTKPTAKGALEIKTKSLVHSATCSSTRPTGTWWVRCIYSTNISSHHTADTCFERANNELIAFSGPVYNQRYCCVLWIWTPASRMH